MDYPDLFVGVDLDAQSVIRDYCGWHIAPSVEETVLFDTQGPGLIFLPSLYVTAIGSVTVDGVAWDSSLFRWWGGGRLEGSWPVGPRLVQVTFTHGYAACPGAVQAAARRLGSVRAPGGTFRIGSVSVSASVDPDGFDPYVKTILGRYAIPSKVV